jgi:hypothetical protein
MTMFGFAAIIIIVIISLVVITLGIIDNGFFYCTVNRMKRCFLQRN